MNKFIDFFFPKTRGDKHATKAVCITAVILVIVVLLNVFSSLLPADKLEYDTSGNHIYELSDTTKDILADLEHDVDLILVYNGTPDTRAVKFVNKYADICSHVTADHVNPAKDTEIITSYNCVNGDLLVRCRDTGKYTTIPITGSSDALLITTVNTLTNETSVTSIEAEGLITGAIRQVTGDVSETVYLLDGHGEQDFPLNASSTIAKNNIAIGGNINLLIDGAIPEDCSALICYSPAADLADDELKILGDFLQGGGNLTLILNNYDLKNFNALLRDYGLEMQEGIVGDVQNYFVNYVNYYGFFCIFPTLSTSSDVTKNIQNSSMLLYPLGMLETEPARDSIKVDTFMTTSENGIIYLDEANYTENVKAVMGACSTEELEGGKKSCLTVLTCASLIDDNITSSFTNMANIDIFINALTANLSDINAISIPAVSLRASLNTITNSTIIRAAFTYVLPLLILVYGVVYCLRRKRR